jgi:hypothetical protein
MARPNRPRSSSWLLDRGFVQSEAAKGEMVNHFEPAAVFHGERRVLHFRGEAGS